MIRLITDRPLAGSRNMAVDQVLLQTAAETGAGSLRVYRWQPATLSLGYFQKWESRQQHAASVDCPLVRRASGGGAIVHDHELTYSLALPSGDRWACENRCLFRLVHQSLIDCLAGLGVKDCQVVTEASPRPAAEPFLCFQRRAAGDVVLDGHKIIGSAQRRLNHALLQHGSVLIRQSRGAPELPGIQDLTGEASCTVERLAEVWPAQLAGQMNWTLEPGELSHAENQRVQQVESLRFAADSWNRKR
jgi:lipoate-protein ligase A